VPNSVFAPSFALSAVDGNGGFNMHLGVAHMGVYNTGTALASDRPHAATMDGVESAAAWRRRGPSWPVEDDVAAR